MVDLSERFDRQMTDKKTGARPVDRSRWASVRTDAPLM